MTAHAWANCSGPAGIPGDITFGSNNVMAYCNGSAWVNMGSSSSVGFGTLTTGDLCIATSATQVSCTSAGISLATQATGTLQAAQFPALTGDVTTTAGSLTTTIGANKVTLGDIAQIAGLSVLATGGATTGNVGPITGTSNQVLVVNNAGTALAFGAINLTSASSVTGILSPVNGGTGINNGANSITLGGPFVTSGAFPLTLTATASTSVTLPTSGTLLSTASSIPTSQLTGTVPVANGGTGDATLTAFGVMVGAGTSGVVTVGPGSAGQLFVGQGAANPAFETISGDVTLTSSGAATVASIGGKAVTLAGTLTTAGAFPLTLTTTGATSVTLPTSGTLLSTTSSIGTAQLTGIVAPANGGTGVANSATITLGGAINTAGAFTTAGAFPLTVTTTASTSVTMPTSGTLLSTTSSIGTSQITGILPVANGGTGAAALMGYLVGNGTGAVTASATIPESALSALSANQVLGSLTATTPSGLSVPSCPTTASALLWTSGTGFSCNTTINAATLGGATFASPGAIGSTTAGAGAFTTLSASSTVSGAGFTTYMASPPAIGGTAAAAANFTTLGASGTITDTQSIGATSTNGLVLQNTTAAASGSQQWSPRVHFDGRGWGTTASSSQAVDMIAELQPIQSTIPTGNLTWSSSINGGSYSPLMTLTTGGNVGIGTTNPYYTLDVREAANERVQFAANLNGSNSGTASIIATNDANSAYVPLGFVASSFDFAYGNVGIGTTSPGSILHLQQNVSGATGPTIRLFDANGTAGAGGAIDFSGTSTFAQPVESRIASYDDGTYGGNLAFLYKLTGSGQSGALVEGFRLSSTGYVGIGTQSPQQVLHIYSNGSPIQVDGPTSQYKYVRYATAGTARWDAGSDNSTESGSNSGSNYYLNTFADNGVYLRTPLYILRSNGNVGIGTTSPTSLLSVVTSTSNAANITLDSSVTSSNATINFNSRASGVLKQGQIFTDWNGNFVMLPATSQMTIGAANGSGNMLAVNGNMSIGSGYAATAAPANGLIVQGSVGIGTASPVALLSVGSTPGNGISMSNSDVTTGAWIRNDGANTVFSTNVGSLQIGYTGSTKNIYFYPGGGTPTMTVVGGNVGIGITSPTNTLHVSGTTLLAGNATVNGTLYMNTTTNPTPVNSPPYLAIAVPTNYDGISVKNTNSQDLLNLWMNSPGNAVQFYIGTSSQTGVGSISVSASATSYNTTSDRRLKENVTHTTHGLEDLLQIPVDDFNFISDPARTRVQGFIAQDLYKIYPEAVTVGGDDAQKKPWAVDYGRLTPLLVKAVQELKADNDNLRAVNDDEEAQIRTLTARLDAIEARRQ